MVVVCEQYLFEKISTIFRFLEYHTEYVSSQSTTYVPNGNNFTAIYGDNSEVDGFYSIDTVTVSFIVGKKIILCFSI
jgi:hypothetical protein